MVYTARRGDVYTHTSAFEATGNTYPVNIAGAIEDIQEHGLAKTRFQDPETQQRCMLGALIDANPLSGVPCFTVAKLIGMLPPKPGDAELISELTPPLGWSGGVTDQVTSRAVDRIAEFNDDPGTTAEDVLAILKRMMEED